MKKQTLTLIIAAAILLTGVIWYSYGSSSGFLGMLKKPAQAGEIPSWCVQDCPSGTYWDYGKYNTDGSPICVSEQSGSTTPGNGGNSGTGSGSTSGSGPKITPGSLSKFPGSAAGSSKLPDSAKQNGKNKLPAGTTVNLDPRTSLKTLQTPVLVKNPQPGKIPGSPTVTLPSTVPTIYTCSCTDVKISSSISSKSFDCPKNFGEFKTYKDTDTSTVYVFKAPESSCHDKWQCPSGYGIDGKKLEECNTFELEKNQKLAQCNGTTAPLDLDAETKAICTAFNPKGVLFQPKYEEHFKNTECISKETCKKYASDKYASEVSAAYGKSDPIYGSMSSLTGTQKTIASCLSLYPGLAWPLGGGGGSNE